jgi:hypothetical protein
MSQPTASQRVARSTRAAAPVYAAHAASVARGQTRTAAAAENNSSGSESDDAADANDDDTPAQQRKQRRSRTTSSAAASASASSCSVRLEHAEPLQVADRPALVEQTRRLLLWRLSDDEEEGDRKEEDEEQPQQSNEVRQTQRSKHLYDKQVVLRCCSFLLSCVLGFRLCASRAAARLYLPVIYAVLDARQCLCRFVRAGAGRRRRG